MRLSSNIPLLVATLAVGENESWDMLGDPSDTAVERFLKWVDEIEKKKLALNASLLRRLNLDLISELLENDNSEDLFVWLKSMPFVQKRSEGWSYHNVVREQMLRYKNRESLSEFSEIHKAFASYYKDLIREGDSSQGDICFTESGLKHSPEFIYHNLSGDPDREVENSIQYFVSVLKQNENSAMRVAEAILQVGNEQDKQKIIKIGQVLCDGLGATKSGSEFDEVPRIRMLKKLIQANPKDGWLYADRAHTFHISKQYKKSLADYRKAISLGYNNHWILERVGEVLSNLGEFREAIESLLAAEKKDQECASCFLIKAETYNLMGEYSEALSAIDAAIFRAPQHHRLHRKKGEILFNQEKYIESLDCLGEAVDLSPSCFVCLFRKARFNHELGNLSTALSDYDKLLEIRPDESSILIDKGSIYQEMGQFSRALEAFNLAVETEKINFKNRDKRVHSESRKDLKWEFPEDIFIKRKKHISNTRVRRRSVKTLREFGFFMGSEHSRFIISYEEDPMVRREFFPALVKWKGALKAKPFLFKAFLCQKMGRLDAALDNVNRAISISGMDFHCSCRGRILLQRKDFSGAFEDFKKSLLFVIAEVYGTEAAPSEEDDVIRHLPEDFDMYQMVYEIMVAEIKLVGFSSARENATIVMKRLVRAIYSEDSPFVLYYISGLYALASMENYAVRTLRKAIEGEPFLYTIACNDVAWEDFWGSPSFKVLRPLHEHGRGYSKGFGV
jgi:tetratricopeptide (TPR) repeat protein